MSYRLLVFCCFLLFTVSAAGQVTPSDKKLRAKELFYHGKYEKALAILSGDAELRQEDDESRFLIAVCHFKVNELDQSLSRLEAIVQEERSPYPECWLYLAKIYHARHEFDEAARYYKLYLRTVRSDNPNRDMVIDEIRRCAKGRVLRHKQPKAAVENLEQPVNSQHDEYAPVQSPNYPDRLYFSAMRQGNLGGLRNQYGSPDEELGTYFSDMYSTRREDGTWGDVNPMDYLLNSMRHEVLLDFRRDGSALYYFKGWSLNKGEIVVNTFQQMEDRILSSDPFFGPLNPMDGDRDFYLANDTLIYFSSRRPGGYGGADIYRSFFQNGEWSVPMNLGPVVNSPYDELTPFMARDGHTLYFSSNNSKYSIGGLDVLKTHYVDEVQSWAEPSNIGIPVNSAGDDAYFRLGKDGFSAFFSSSRKDGYGMRDIYAAYFFDFLPEQEPPASFASQQVNGEIPARPEPAVERFQEEDKPAGEQPVLPENANSDEAPSFWSPIVFETADELLYGQNQSVFNEIAALMKEYPQLKLVITARSAQSLSVEENIFEAVRNAERVAAYLQQQGVDPGAIFLRGLNGLPPVAGGRSGNQSVGFSFLGTLGLPVQGKLPVIGNNYSSGESSQPINEAMMYKVQVSSLRGAYRRNSLPEYSWPMVETMPGFGYYRYTLGATPSFEEAQKIRKELISKGFSGAFIVPYIYGFRADKTMVKRHLGVFPRLNQYLNQ